MIKAILAILQFTNVYSQYIDTMPPIRPGGMRPGGDMNTHGCIVSAGYNWCESSQMCLRQWEIPCSDNYNDCSDCLKRQRKGENIACPPDCDMPNIAVNSILTSIHDFPTPDGLSPVGGQDNPCEICPPPAPCPMPSPGCYYTPSDPDECGCIIGCGEFNCDMSILNPFTQLPAAPPSRIMCTELQLAIFNRCNLLCNDCDINDVLIVLGDCYINNEMAGNNLCYNECEIIQPNCNNKYVCPKITEITHCSEGGIDGYTTYQLSLIVQPDMNVKNIYAIFGDEHHNMHIPGAYHTDGIFGTNLGGISPSLISIYPDSKYDSWLTIDIIDGDLNNYISTIGIDYNIWTETYPLNVEDGAIYLMDPEMIITNNMEHIIGQLTIRSNIEERVIINVQGKQINPEKISGQIDRLGSWVDYQIEFILRRSENNNIISNSCTLWYDGCNTCMANNGILSGCTRLMCFTEDAPECRTYITSGH